MLLLVTTHINNIMYNEKKLTLSLILSTVPLIIYTNLYSKIQFNKMDY